MGTAKTGLLVLLLLLITSDAGAELRAEAACFNTIVPNAAVEGGYRHGGDTPVCRDACAGGSSVSCLIVGIDLLSHGVDQPEKRAEVLASSSKYISRGCALEKERSSTCNRAKFTHAHLRKTWGL